MALDVKSELFTSKGQHCRTLSTPTRYLQAVVVGEQRCTYLKAIGEDSSRYQSGRRWRPFWVDYIHRGTGASILAGTQLFSWMRGCRHSCYLHSTLYESVRTKGQSILSAREALCK